MQKKNKKPGRNRKFEKRQELEKNKEALTYVKPNRPSKAMMDALEAEGFHVCWPDDLYCILKGTFKTPGGSEHSVDMYFTEDEDIMSCEEVDYRVARYIYEAWMEYNWEYALSESVFGKLRREGKLCWDEVLRELKDKIRTERILARLCFVAYSVAGGEPVPPREKEQGYCETVHITPQMAGGIRDCLIKAYPSLKGSPCAKNIKETIDSLAEKLEIEESFNEETGVAEPGTGNRDCPLYKPMPLLV